MAVLDGDPDRLVEVHRVLDVEAVEAPLAEVLLYVRAEGDAMIWSGMLPRGEAPGHAEIVFGSGDME